MVVDKEARLYVGSGSNQGLSEDALKEQVANQCGVNAEEVHRVSIRGAYSFVDVPEKVADQVIEKLSEADLPGGKGGKYFVKRAVTLSIPREPTAEELAALQSENEERYGSSDEGDESYDDRPRNGGRSRHHHDEQSDEGAGEDEGPTLLAVDDQA